MPRQFTFTDRGKWEKDAVESAIEFAKVFEEHQVEYYSPIVELDLVLNKNNLDGEMLNSALENLAEAIHPQARSIFKGKIIAKATENRTFASSKQSEEAWVNEAQGADFIALDFGDPANVPNMDYRQTLRTRLAGLVGAARRLDIPWGMGEYWQGEVQTETQALLPWDSQGVAIALDEIGRTQPKLFGFTFDFWQHVEGEENKKVYELFKEFFSKL